MGSIALTTANGISLNGTLPAGTKIFLDVIDLGENVRENRILTSFGRPRGTLAASQIRPTTMQMRFWLEGTSVANIMSDTERVRDEFRVANVLSWSPDYPGVAIRGIETFPSAVAPILSSTNENNLRYLVRLGKVLDWTLTIERQAGYSGNAKEIVG